jgi:uncharacterized iron-regulated membrane protein
VIDRLHLWGGVLLATPLLIAALTGALLLFKSDYIRWSVPAAARELPAFSAPDLATQVEQAEQLFGSSLQTLRFADDRIALNEVWLANDRAAYLDPLSGKAVKEWSRKSNPVDVLFEIHHHLLAGKTGTAITGTAALLASVIAFFGVWMWLRQSGRFRLRIWPAKNGRPALLATHRDLAIVVVAPLLLTLLTGAVLAFPNASRSMLNAALPGEVTSAPSMRAAAGDVNWKVAFGSVAALYPNATIRMVVWPAKAGAPASVRVRQPAEWHPNGRTTLWIDPASSKVIDTRDALLEPTGTRVANAAYPLHAATIGSPWLRWIMLVTALALILLVSYGVLAWLRTLQLDRLRAESMRHRVDRDVHSQTQA